MTTASTIVSRNHTTGAIAKAAMSLCCKYHKVNRKSKETFSFRDGSTVTITNHRIEVN